MNHGVILWYCSKEQSELDQDLDDVEEVEEEETGEETNIKGIILNYFRCQWLAHGFQKKAISAIPLSGPLSIVHLSSSSVRVSVFGMGIVREKIYGDSNSSDITIHSQLWLEWHGKLPEFLSELEVVILSDSLNND